MFELTLSTTKSQSIADKIFEKISTYTKDICPLIVKHTNSKSFNICLAFPNKYVQFVSACVIDVIADIISFDYKFEYLSKHIYMSTITKSSFNKLIYALACFDNKTDKEIVRHVIEFSNYIAIDSYYNFRLGDLKSRWADIASIVNDNIEYMLATNSLEEIIGYFTESNKEYAIEVIMEKTCIRLIIPGKNNNICYYKSDDYFELVANEIIALAPAKVIFQGNNFELEKLLEKLPSEYSNKIFKN